MQVKNKIEQMKQLCFQVQEIAMSIEESWLVEAGTPRKGKKPKMHVINALNQRTAKILRKTKKG